MAKTDQFQNHVPLYHLRRPLDVGHVIEVCTDPERSWELARIKESGYGATDRFYELVLDTKEVTVPGSSIRRCLLAKSEVFVYRGPVLG